MGEQGGLRRAQGHQAVLQAGTPAEVGLQHQAGQARSGGRESLAELQFRLLFQDQQHPQRQQARAALTDQLQGNLGPTGDTQGQQLGGTSMVELHRPVLFAPGRSQGVAQGQN